MHLGHYFSVIKPAMDFGATVLIAEYHAPKSSREEVLRMQETLSAFGIQDVRFQTDEFDAEVYFQLLSIARVGELSRMTQFMSAGDDNDAHLLVYPVLMVHDVMGYDEIFVGEDQQQHINYSRDLIERYNREFKGDIRLPIARTVGGRVMSLSDPSKKMSKSEPEGCLFLDDSPQEIDHKIKKAVMDDVGHANLVELYHSLGGTEAIPRMNSDFKPMVRDVVIRALEPVIVEES